MTSQMTLPPRAYAGLAALALIWGFSFLAMRIALDEIGPFTLVAHRVGWAALAVWVVAWARGIPVPTAPSTLAVFAVMGLLNNVIPFSLIAFGQQHIPTGLGSILNASTAIWGVFVAALLLPDERLTRAKVGGVILGFIGVTVAIGVDTLRALDLRSISQLAFLAAGLSYALAGVWARKRLRGIAPEAAAAGMLTASALVSIPLAYAVEGQISFALDLRTWTALGYASLIATALAFLLFYRVIAIAGSGNTLLNTLAVAPVAIVAGAIFLDEALALRAYAGFALVALGLAVLDGRLWPRITGRGPKEVPQGTSGQKPLAPLPPGG